MKVIVIPHTGCFGACTCVMSFATDYGFVVTVSISEECEYPQLYKINVGFLEG